MDAVIKVSPEEFDENLFAKVKSLLKNSADSKVIIEIASKNKNLLEDPASEYWTKINQSIKDLENGKGVVFTMEELEEYVNKQFSE
jgi:hypothetical protein